MSHESKVLNEHIGECVKIQFKGEDCYDYGKLMRKGDKYLLIGGEWDIVFRKSHAVRMIDKFGIEYKIS